MGGSFDIGSIVAKITADLSGFKDGINEAKAQATSMGEHINNVAENIRGFAEKAAIVVGAQSLAFEELGRRAVDVASNFEQTQTSFGTLLHSEEKAAELMKELMAFEQNTPFDITTLTTVAKQMLGVGIAAKDIVPIMSQLTDASQGSSAKLMDLTRIYGQVVAAQKLNGREVMELQYAQFPIIDLLEQHYSKLGGGVKVTGAEITKMISAGKISMDVFNQVLGEATQKGGLYYQENIRQMSTFSGIVSSTKSQLEYAILNIMGIDIGAANEVRKGGLFDTLRNLAGELLAGLKRLQPILAEVGKNRTFQLAVEGFVIALASLVVIIPIVIAALNPVVLIVLAIEAVIIALYIAWNSNFLGIRDVTRNVTNEVMNFFNNYLTPLINQFMAFWRVAWPIISAVLTAAWKAIAADIKLYWDIAYGILKIGIDLLTGNWKRAWDDIKQTVSNVWGDVGGILNGAINTVKNWGGAIFNALTQPFKDALGAIINIVKQIQDRLDFTKRHSPSVLDIVQSGVAKVNEALTGINLTPQISTGDIASNILTPLQGGAFSPAGAAYNINIDMGNAIISDAASANRIGEIVGDSIIKRLQQNVRF